MFGLPEFPKPFGSAKEFKEWDDKLEAEYPYRRRVEWFVRRIHARLVDGYWKILHTYHPKYQYHKVTIPSLAPGYTDVRERMLHVAFDMFCQFMDRIYDDDSHVVWFYEEGDENRAYASDEEIERVNTRWNEMQTLYAWWMVQRPNREEMWSEHHPPVELPDEWGFMSPFNTDYDDEPLMREWRARARKRNEMDFVWDQEDDEMFIRLVRIRQSLWD